MLNRLFRSRAKKPIKLRVTCLCEGNQPVTDGFPSQRVSNAGNDSIWWRHRVHFVFNDCIHLWWYSPNDTRMLHNFQRVFTGEWNSIRLTCPGCMISHNPVMRSLFLFARTSCWISNQDLGFETSQIMWHHSNHDDVIECKHMPPYGSFVRGIHRWSVNSPHKGQWRGVLMFSLICGWTNDWANSRDAADLRRHNAHYDVTVMMADSWNSSC